MLFVDNPSAVYNADNLFLHIDPFSERKQCCYERGEHGAYYSFFWPAALAWRYKVAQPMSHIPNCQVLELQYVTF